MTVQIIFYKLPLNQVKNNKNYVKTCLLNDPENTNFNVPPSKYKFKGTKQI